MVPICTGASHVSDHDGACGKQPFCFKFWYECQDPSELLPAMIERVDEPFNPRNELPAAFRAPPPRGPEMP